MVVVKSFCTSTLLRVLTPLISRDSVTGTAVKSKRDVYGMKVSGTCRRILTQTVHYCGLIVLD